MSLFGEVLGAIRVQVAKLLWARGSAATVRIVEEIIDVGDPKSVFDSDFGKMGEERRCSNLSRIIPAAAD